MANYICPGCLFYGETTLVKGTSYFQCNKCLSSLLKSKNSDFFLRKRFGYYNKSGYRCLSCDRFIPSNINGDNNIICPYPNCSFVGNSSILKKMRHPFIKDHLNESKPIENILIIKLKRIIIDLKNRIEYESIPSTVFHKIAVYDAILSLLDDFPNEIISYLRNDNKYYGFQHKIFHRYILSIESKLPISFLKYKKLVTISSLLDDELGIFSGISEFESVISEKLVIKNNTKDMYIGKRKGTIVRQYYIGHLINIFDENKNSILDDVDDYSFNLIKLNRGIPGKKVTVTHLKIIPHYEMGGMVYVNKILRRIKKEVENEHIIDC